MKRLIHLCCSSLKVLIPAVILLVAAVGAFGMIETAPKAQKKRPAAVIPTVEIASFAKETHSISIPVMGTVEAAHSITLTTRLEGEVVSVDAAFMPGGMFKAGQELLQIDPRDYAMNVKEMEYEVATAQYDVEVEEGYQDIAKQEWGKELLGVKKDPDHVDLIMRKPHLAKVKAELESAKAKLQQAKIDLERTHVTAPFASVVQTKSTDLGATVAAQDALATLVGVDAFWVEASVPEDRLDRISFPSATGDTPGSTATVISGSGKNANAIKGEVIRLLPGLEEDGRMARVLIQIKDPLNLQGDPQRKPLLLGSYVNVSIDAGELTDSYAIPRSAFRDDAKLWVLGENGALDIREVAPVWRDENTIYLQDGLKPGEQVVLTTLSAPVAGMKLQAANTSAASGKLVSVSDTVDAHE